MAELEATIAARRPLDWGATERWLWPKRPVRAAGAFFFLSFFEPRQCPMARHSVSFLVLGCIPVWMLDA